MDDVTTPSNGYGSTELDVWSARKIRPIVILYVLGVFAAFMVVSFFVFHSTDALKALALAAVGAVAATVPGVMERVEYRLTESGIEKRTLKTKTPREFSGVFRWAEVSHVVPMKHGFRYFKTLNEKSPLRRFWKVHFSDEYSGEVHVEKEDLAQVLEIVARQGIAIS